jgi:hypothetical protein
MIPVLTQHRRAPAAIQERLARAGGRNRFGEPNFRVVWGWDRLTWIGGKWEDWEHDAKGMPTRLKSVSYEYRQMPKYEDYWRWHVETWRPPEFYGSPARWAEQYTVQEDGRSFLELGPYPQRGEYELCFTVQTPAGQYLDLTPRVAELVVRAVVWSRYRVQKDKSKSLAALRAREAKKQRDWDTWADAVLDDAAPAFGLQPKVSFAGLNARA